jgi:hypothetical protein
LQLCTTLGTFTQRLEICHAGHTLITLMASQVLLHLRQLLFTFAFKLCSPLSAFTLATIGYRTWL